MPELPEVQTTVDGLNQKVKGWKIVDVWNDYNSPHYANKDQIKSPAFFKIFQNHAIGATITSSARRAKNILIHLSNNKTILIHMKMTGHMMFGEYKHHKLEPFGENKGQPVTRDHWRPIDESKLSPLNDPFNKFIRLVFTLESTTSEKKERGTTKKRGEIKSPSARKQLVLSDMRKFAKVTVLDTKTIDQSADLKGIGPEPLDLAFTFPIFETQLDKRKTTPIKQALMDQSLIAGIGNIYSDEILWHTGVHPKSQFEKIPATKRKEIFKASKEILIKGISFGGDSMSDYRNIDGLPGEFQGQHKSYRRTGLRCLKRGCIGMIKRMVIGGRSAHYCDVHQVLF